SLRASGQDGGGSASLEGSQVLIKPGGAVDASGGELAGDVTLSADGVIGIDGTVRAAGRLGGSIDADAGGSLTVGGTVDVSGSEQGGTVDLAGGDSLQLGASARVLAS